MDRTEDGTPLRPWVRIDAATFQDPDLIDGGFEACAAFIAVLTRAKLMGRRGGLLTEHDIRPLILARHMAGGAEQVRLMEVGVARLLESGVLIRHGTSLKIARWWKYQNDPRASIRTKRWRERKKPRARDTSHNVNGHEAEIRSGTDVTICDVGDDDVTGRSPVEALRASSTGLSAQERAARLPPGVAMHGVFRREAPPQATSDTARIIATEKAKMREALERRTAKATALGGEGTEGGHDGLAR